MEVVPRPFEPNSHGEQVEPTKGSGLPDKAKIFDRLKSTERSRKIGRGIQIVATAVAVVAVAAGAAVLIGGLAATPVGWGILGAGALAIGVTVIAAAVSKSRGGSFWNEVMKPQLTGLAIGVTSVVAALLVGAIALGGGGGGFSAGFGGATSGFTNSMMLGSALGTAGGISLPVAIGNNRAPEPGELRDGPAVNVELMAAGKITKEGRVYNPDDAKLYDEAVKFVAKGTQPNLERAARRLEVLVERNPNDRTRKLELAELCMMMKQPARAARLYEEVRKDQPQLFAVAGKEVKALRKSGQYDQAITLGTAYTNQAASEAAGPRDERYSTLISGREWIQTQITQAQKQQAKEAK